MSKIKTWKKVNLVGIVNCMEVCNLYCIVVISLQLSQMKVVIISKKEE